MNVFTTDAFLDTAGACFFPGRDRRVELFEVEGRLLKLLVVDGRVIERMPFYDYPQPLDVAPPGPVKPLRYFPRTVVTTEPVEARTGPEAPGLQPSPYVDWARFPTWAEYEAWVKGRAGSHSGDPKRARRRIERELGPLQFVLDDRRPEAFDATVRWKSSQYLATGLPDMFAARANVTLFRELHARGVLQVSALWAGTTLMATHFGAHTDRRLAWWVPAYEPALGKYSPGKLLLEELMKASHAAGDLEFDFLIGEEAYKFQFATHNRVIGPVGQPPLEVVLRTEGERQLKALLERVPGALGLARQVKKRLQQRG